MEVKIGVTHANREITFDTESSADEVHKAVSDALTTEQGVFELRSEKGGVLYIPADKLAYVEIPSHAGRRVGFGTG